MAVALLISCVAFGQAKQQRTVGAFSGISGATGIEIELTQGNENAVSVSADDKYINDIKTVVEDGILKIYFDGNMHAGNKGSKLKAFVTYKSINKIKGSSGTIMTAKNTVNASSLSFDMSSGAIFSGDIKTTDLTIDQNSGALATVTGTASSVKAEVNSGGIFTGKELSSENCTVTASSGGVIKIGVSKKLTAKANSGGVVNYKGNPDVERSTSVGGVVSKI